MSSPNSVFGNYGITRLMDQMGRSLRPGPAGDICFLRVKNFNPTAGPVAQMGFTFTPTASGALSGFTDYQIDPPPLALRLVSMHNLGQASQAGIQLRAGARDILISNTFVQANMILRKLTSLRAVFEDPSTVGLVVDGGKTMVSFDGSVMPDIAYGTPSTWNIIGNANEIR